jgi:hypothetical protein
MALLDKIYCPEEQRERATKALKLNGGSDYDPRLLAAFSFTSKKERKPTIRIKRLSFSNPGNKLKDASSIQNQLQKEREKAEKALRLNCG